MSNGIGQLLDRLHLVRRACDLDLLLFLHRHPRALLPCEGRLAAFSGYDPDDIARTLEGLIDAGLVERRQSPSRAVCLYRLARDGRRGEWLASLMTIAATRGGRLEVLHALASGCAPEHTASDIVPHPPGSASGA